MDTQTLYPDFKNLFAEVKNGRKFDYTPTQIAEEFEKYIEDLAKHPIVVEVEVKKTSGFDGGQTRVEKYPPSPTISDFCSRWLGKSIRWWSELDKAHNPKIREAYIKVKNIISCYCRKVKLNGAEVGIYNPSIVARELGLVEKQQVEQTGRTIQYVVATENDAEELKKAINGVGLVE